MAENRYPWLAWQPTGSGSWEREIDEAEQFYTLFAKSYERTGCMAFAITGYVSISIETDTPLESVGQHIEEALRQAWLRLRYDHPTIASRVEYNPQQGKWMKSCTTFDPEQIELQTEEWLRETFVPVSPSMTGLEWCNTESRATVLPTLFIITPPCMSGEEGQRRDVVFRSPHDVVDGIGTLQLFNNLLKHAVETYEMPSSFIRPSGGDEVHNLSPPLRVAKSIPPILSLDQQQQLQVIIASNAALRQKIEMLSIPFKKGTASPGRHQRFALELSAAETARLLESSKRIGATITHIYHAAISICTRDSQERKQASRPGRYISNTLINERPNCAGAYVTSNHPATVYHSITGVNLALDLTIPALSDGNDSDNTKKEEFLNLVEQVRDYYHQIRNSSSNRLALAPPFFSMVTPHISDPTIAPPIPASNLSPSISLSSMGVVDKIIAPQHGPFKVSNPWVTGDELGTGLGVFLGTWKGKISVSVAYNDAWHNKEEVSKFLQHVQNVVRGGVWNWIK